MMTDRYLPVLLDYHQPVNPEPGVAHAPSLAEQRRAIGRLATGLGGELTDEAIIVTSGAQPPAVEIPANTSGVIMFSVQALGHGPMVDIATLVEIWRQVGSVRFLVENLAARDEAGFERLVDMFLAINTVVDRDRSPTWREVVHTLSPAIDDERS
jgi:hypothetical protein